MLCGLVVGCQPAAPPMKQASPMAWTLRFPDDWERLENVPETAVVGRARQSEGGFAPNVNLQVIKFDGPTTLQSFYDQQFDPKALPSGLEVVETADTKLAGRPAKREVYRHTYDGRKLQVLTYLLVAEREGFVLTCTATQESFDRHLKEFEDICATLELSPQR